MAFAGLSPVFQTVSVDRLVVPPQVIDFDDGDGALNLDVSVAQIAWVNMTNNITTLTLTGTPAAGTRVSIFFQQTAAGKTVTTWANFKWAGGGTPPTFSATITNVDCVTAIYDGSNWYADKALNFA